MNKCPGPKLDDKPAREYILKLYMVCNPDPDRSCYSHFTTATGVFKAEYFEIIRSIAVC